MTGIPDTDRDVGCCNELNVELLTYIGDGHYFSWSFGSGIEIVPEEYIIINEFENIVRGSINEWDWFNEANKPE